jgi:DNA-binding NarL/FixJ family response regulator
MIHSTIDSNAPGPGPSSKIVVVEDHPMFRERLVQVIQSAGGMTVCGEADSVPEAMNLLQTSRPDAAVVDISLRNSNGLDLIKQLKASRSEVRVLVLSNHDETLYAEKSLHAGARGYLMKQAPTGEVLTAIRKVLAGEVYLSAAMMNRVLHWAANYTPGAVDAGVRSLSEREVQVFEAIGHGRSVREIAEFLNVGESSIHTYRARIKEKLGLKDSGDLSVCAVRWINEQRFCTT